MNCTACAIGKLTICNPWQFSPCRKFRNLDIPSGLLKLAPESCGIYVISKGKIQSRSRPQKPTSAASSPRKPEIPTSAVSDGRQVRTPATPPGQPQTPPSNAATPRHLQMLTYISTTPRQQNH